MAYGTYHSECGKVPDTLYFTATNDLDLVIKFQAPAEASPGPGEILMSELYR